MAGQVLATGSETEKTLPIPEVLSTDILGRLCLLAVACRKDLISVPFMLSAVCTAGTRRPCRSEAKGIINLVVWLAWTPSRPRS